MTKPKPYNLLFLTFFLTFPVELLLAQDEEIEIVKCARLEAGYIFTNQISNKDLLDSPGYYLSYSYGVKTGEYLGVGLGAGLLLFEKENFVPLYLNLMISTKPKQNSTFVDLQGGYSIGWTTEYSDYEDHHYKAGTYLHAGIGRRFRVGKNFCIALKGAYIHQFASLTYTTSDQVEHFSRLHYNMVMMSIGLLLEQK